MASLDNRTGYDSKDLKRFFERGARALGKRGLEIVAVTSPGRTRGCGEVGGKRLVMQIASPSRFSHRKLARLYEHEVKHTLGKEHSDMSEAEYWSKGGDPTWAEGLPVRYKRRGRSTR